jgi:hypothetical protein
VKICPQHLPIPDHLKEVSKEMDRGMIFIVPVLKCGLWGIHKIGRIREMFSSGKKTV